MTTQEITHQLKNGWHVILPTYGNVKIQVFDENSKLVWDLKLMSDIPWPSYWRDSTRSHTVEQSTFLYVNGDDGVRLSVACSFAPLQVIFELKSGKALGVVDAR